MSPTDPAFWGNPKTWGPVVAVVALILSQLPPVRSMIKGRRARLGAAPYVVISHYLGNVRVGLRLNVDNVGGKPVHNEQLVCVLCRADNDIPLKLRGYWIESGDTSVLL